MMKRARIKLVVLMAGIYLLIPPAPVDALLSLTGNSQSGMIVTTGSILIPVPFITLAITASRETDFFGIAKLTISEYDDTNNYNILQIRTAAGDPIHLPVPYGSLGLLYRMQPQGLSPLNVNQSDVYGYLSVAHGAVMCTIESSLHFSMSFEREELIALLRTFMPDSENLAEFIGEGPFEIACTLDGSLAGTATAAYPTITGSFNYALNLPQGVFPGAPSPDMPVPDALRGRLLIEAIFNWDHWGVFAPFVSVTLSLRSIFQEEELPLEPVTLDFLPRGTTIIWLDRDE